MIPFINVKHRKLLPLPVVMNAAGLLCNVNPTSPLLRVSFPTEPQCRYLNELCATAGLDFMFDTKTSLVSVTTMSALTDPMPYTRELPMHDPFSHAEFIDENLLGGAQTSNTSNSVASRDVMVPQSTAGLPTYQPVDVLSTLQSQVSYTYLDILFCSLIVRTLFCRVWE